LSSDGTTAIVGAKGDAGGVGAAWVYTRAGGVWTQQAKLVGSAAAGLAAQGTSVAISGDGNTAIIGGPLDQNGAGAAWIFARSGGVWIQQGSKLVGSLPGGVFGASQGFSVALSGDGNTALIGGPNDNNFIGAVWVYVRNGSTWTQQGGKIVPTDYYTAGNASYVGWSVALSSDGNTLVTGAPMDSGYGAVWFYTRSNGVWAVQGATSTNPGGKFFVTLAATNPAAGYSVDLSSDGNTAIIGGPNDNQSSTSSPGTGATWIVTRSGGVWTQQAKLVGTFGIGQPSQGRSVSISSDGSIAFVGGSTDSTNVGASWAFQRVNSTWTQLGSKIVGNGNSPSGTGSGQGTSVAVSGDGNTAMVGAPNDSNTIGAAWAFSRGGSSVLPATHFSVVGPTTAVIGIAVNYTVTALDQNNNTATSYAGTIHFTSSDGAATLPGNTTLAGGTGTFSVTFRSTGNQSVSVVDTVNSSIAGTSAIAAVSGTATPQAGSVFPTAGTAASQAATFTFSDAAGVQSLGVMNILVNSALDGRKACYLAYVRSGNVLYLVADDGGTLSPGQVLTAAGSLSNSQCTVSWGASPVTTSGNSLLLTLNLAYTTAFAGNKIVYLAAGDVSNNNSGWQPLGVWQVPGGTSSITTTVLPMIPAHATGLTANSYQFTFTDTRGYQDLGVENILVGYALDGRHACYLAFARSISVLYLVNDNGDALLPGQVVTSAGTLSNSQCTVTWAANPATGNGNNLTLNLNIAFSAAFAGNRVFFVAARDVNEANNTGWQTIGTWSVQ